MSVVCVECNKEIDHPREIERIDGRTYHYNCLKCFKCQTALNPSNYHSRGQNIYCESHKLDDAPKPKIKLPTDDGKWKQNIVNKKPVEKKMLLRTNDDKYKWSISTKPTIEKSTQAAFKPFCEITFCAKCLDDDVQLLNHGVRILGREWGTEEYELKCTKCFTITKVWKDIY